MGLPAPRLRVSPAEYLAAERASTEKHILWDGEVFAMAGASFRHNIVAGNIVRMLGNVLLSSPCVTTPSDLKVRFPGEDRYVYPDAVVASPPHEFEDEDVLLNPTVIVEVLSDSTEAFDRGEKFAAYRGMESVRHILFIATKSDRVEQYRRINDGTWQLWARGAGESVILDEFGVSLAVDEIYRKADRNPTAQE